MDTKGVSHIVVIGDHGVCGIVSRHDVNLFVRADLDLDSSGSGMTFWMSPQVTVRMAMTPDPIAISPGASIRTAARQMVDAHIHALLVVDPDASGLAGILTSTDLMRFVAQDG